MKKRVLCIISAGALLLFCGCSRTAELRIENFGSEFAGYRSTWDSDWAIYNATAVEIDEIIECFKFFGPFGLLFLPFQLLALPVVFVVDTVLVPSDLVASYRGTRHLDVIVDRVSKEYYLPDCPSYARLAASNVSRMFGTVELARLWSAADAESRGYSKAQECSQ